jgi:hypothetical protein
MRLFYSELSANPALYSFGYSVYGELEPEDRLAECYELGFLPFVGTERQEGKLMYMARGSRVHIPEFSEKHYHSRVRRKVASLGTITSVVHPTVSFELTRERKSFFLDYFHFRFGKESMPEKRLEALISSGFVTHVREYLVNGRTAAYILEVHGDSFVHTWYHAYAKEFEGSHLGSYLYIDLLQTLKAQGVTYLYFGITYGSWMSYKLEFQPLTYWNGKEWADGSSSSLKPLLQADSERLLTFTDPWREAQMPYYKAPYPFDSVRNELRLLILVIYGLPRTAKISILFIMLVMVLALWRMIFG